MQYKLVSSRSQEGLPGGGTNDGGAQLTQQLPADLAVAQRLQWLELPYQPLRVLRAYQQVVQDCASSQSIIHAVSSGNNVS